MNSKGYSIIEVLVLIIVIGVAFFIAINKMSYAFDDKSKEVYDNEIKLIKTCAKKYGEEKKDEVRSSVTGLKINLNDLVKTGCLKDTDKDGHYILLGPKKQRINNVNINLTYNNKNNDIDVEILK